MINESMTNFKAPNQFYYNDIKYYKDGTFEMIPEEPEWMKIDIGDYMKQQSKLINGGKNILEIIKTLPCVAIQKLQMYKFLEPRDAKKIPSYCEFIGLSASHIDMVQELVDHFIENGGVNSMRVIAADYETEIYRQELENPTFSEGDIEAQRARVKLENQEREA